MSKEKQIEEMAQDLCPLYEEYKSCKTCDAVLDIGEKPCVYKCMAELITTKGYRKQSVGRWEKRVFVIFDSEKIGYRCSECNTTWDTETPYCPNCGAKMRKEDEGK